MREMKRRAAVRLRARVAWIGAVPADAGRWCCRRKQQRVFHSRWAGSPASDVVDRLQRGV